MPIDIDRALGIHAEALRLRAQRAEVLAANLANSDTPGYLARDMDFHAMLLQTIPGQRPGPVVLRVTHPAHLGDSNPPSLPEGMLRYRLPAQPSLDGNTVDSRRESAEFLDNAVRYQASLTFVNGRLRTLLTAIRGE